MKIRFKMPGGVDVEAEGPAADLAQLLTNLEPDPEQKFVPVVAPEPKPDAVTLPCSYVLQRNTCTHEFPEVWHGIVPPACKKCGAMAQTYTVTGTIDG